MPVPTRKRVRLLPDALPGGGLQFPQTIHNAQNAINRLPKVTTVSVDAGTTKIGNDLQLAGMGGVWSQSGSVLTFTVNAITCVSSLNALTGALTLAGQDNAVVSAAGSTVTIRGRKGPRYGYQWPGAGANITLAEDDRTIYGTAGQHAGAVTFPLAASFPGKEILFTYPPGSLVASGADTVDAYSGATACYQSDGVSAWKRIWSV